MIKKIYNPNIAFALATALGIFSGYLGLPLLFSAAHVVSEIFMNLLKLVSLPIIFLSIVSTASGMESLTEVRNLGKKVVKYTLLTTILAATVALAVFIGVHPVRYSGPFEA